MNDFQFYLQLGLKHVLDLNAYDHVLFLIVLSVSYTFVTWRKLLLLITVFTLGHTISLILAAYNVLSPNTVLVECLIPVTIFIGAISNLLTLKKTHKGLLILFVLTIIFGLIHGFGFASYYKMINNGEEVLPLISFAIGVELSQIIIAVAILILGYVFQNILKITQRIWILVVSILIIIRLLPMLYNSCYIT